MMTFGFHDAPAMNTSEANSRPLADRHAVVTGGGHGLGAAIADELARQGARLTLLGRNADRLNETAACLAETHGVDVDARIADVTDEAALGRALDFEAGAEPLILVNNAGIAAGGPFEAEGLESWRRMLEINLLGAVTASRVLLPAMRRAGWGRIVNLGSTAGLIGYGHAVAYTASKHALVGMTRALALELARTGITVNAVCPGYADTEMGQAAVSNLVSDKRDEAEALRLLVRRNPQARLIEPAEVAATVGWLVGPGTQSVTGQAIAIAGGEVT